MLKATLRKGSIVPLEPVPADWEEGAALEIDKVTASNLDIDAWVTLMDQLCADSLPEDEESMRLAIAKHRKEAKEQVRKQMGLSA